MRKLMLGGAALAATIALGLTGAAGAQMRPVAHGPGAGYPMPGAHPMPPMAHPMPPMAHPMPHPGPMRPMPHGNRWGSKVGGHWWGGVNAPGGWNAYRRPARGYVLPSYWVAPRFYVSDWSSYGLAQPPVGYNWARYYDDAVLIDGRGSVYDSVSGVDWDGYGDGYADAGYPDAYAEGDVPPPPAGPRYGRRDDGLGGAAVGAVAGGVAGNLIAGRGNRLGGTLIGAGVGAAAGYAIDRAEDAHRGPPPYRGGYDHAPPPPGYGLRYAPAYPPRPLHYAYGPSSWTSPDGATTVVTTSTGGAYGTGSTTVTVQVQPVVTTTTTTTYEDAVTYSRPAVRHVYRKRWVAKPRCSCR